MIKRCDGCKSHAYQDAQYGPGMRVMSVTKTPTARCSVCEKEYPIGAQDVKKKGKK